jgi:hypothetical protein
MPDKSDNIRRTGARIVAVILAFVMLLRQADAVFGATDKTVQPEVQLETGQVKLASRAVRTRGTSRIVKVYMPEGALQGTYFTVLAPPEEVSAEDFLLEYGWKAYADTHQEGLLVLEPRNNHWGSPEAELAYVEAVFEAFSDSKDYITYGSYYMAGYDAGGSALQMYAMAHPEQVIGASFIRACDISSRYMERMAAGDGDDAGDGITVDKAVPVLIYDDSDGESTEAAADYWIGAGQAELALDNTSKSCHVRTYIRKSDDTSAARDGVDLSVSVFTDCTEAFINEAVVKGHESVLRKLTRGSFLSDGSERLIRRMDLIDDCEVFPINHDGVKKDGIVYIPDSVKYSGKLSPVLYIFGDYAEPVNMLLDKLSFRTFAEERGAIIATVCASLIQTEADVDDRDDYPHDADGWDEYARLAGELCTYVNEAYPVDLSRSVAVIYEGASGEAAIDQDEAMPADSQASSLAGIISNLPKNIIPVTLSDWSELQEKYGQLVSSVPSAETEASTYDGSIAAVQVDEEAVRSFIERMYTSFLGREAEEEGLEQWVDALTHGVGTASEAVSGFVFSNEYQENPISSRDYIRALYNIIFQRNPEEIEIRDWMSVLSMGCTREKILEGFLNSVEMKELCRGMGIAPGSFYSDEFIDKHPDVTAFVSSLYEKILHRRAAGSETEAWVRCIVEGYPASKVAEKFFLSKECEWTLFSDFDFLTELYSTAYGQIPDMDAYALWLRTLRNGVGRDDVVAEVYGEETLPAGQNKPDGTQNQYGA